MRRVVQSLRGRQDASARAAEASSEQRPIDSLPVLPRFPAPISTGPFEPAAANDGAFFRLLPAELRHQILVHAFGGRTIHLDLFYTYGDIRTPHTTADTELRHRRDWRWRVWSCHRQPSTPSILCECTSGAPPTDCSAHTTPCRVGGLASGWLRASRRAYAEGIKVLYGGNAFFVTSGAMLLRTHHLLPRHHCSAIRSLVVLLSEANLREETRKFFGARWEGDAAWYTQLILAIREGFPGLKKLEISLLDSLRLFSGVQGDRWLVPLDDLVLAFGAQLEDVQVLLQPGLFSSLSGLDNDGRIDDSPTPGLSSDEQMTAWRPVGVESKGGRRPLATQSSPTTRGELGYWLKSIPYQANMYDLLTVPLI